MTLPGPARPSGDPPRPARPVAIYGSFSFGQYYEDILAGTAAAAEAAGVGVIAVQASAGVLPSFHEVGGQEAVSRSAWDHFDAAIVILQTLSLEYVARLRRAGKFVVAIAPQPRGAQATVRLDNESGVGAAVAHLIDHGHTRIGFVSPGWQVDTRERYAAYRAKMAESGLVPLPLMGEDLPTELTMDQQGYLAAQQFLSGNHACTAVMVVPDLVALGFMRGVREAGVAVPDQLAIVGADDIPEAAVSTPSLATVAISFRRVGQIACELAMRGAAGEQVEGCHLVPQRFVPRESCGCASSSGSAYLDTSRDPADAFAHLMLEVARDGANAGSVDAGRVAAVARQVHGFLRQAAGVPHGNPDPTARPTIEVLASEINQLCPRDRSVQTAMHGIRALADAVAGTLADREPARTWRMSAAALDLCDAIRSRQLQERMAEYLALKRLQITHYFIGNSLLGSDRSGLRSLGWLGQTPAQAGVLGLWTPGEQGECLTIQGVFTRPAPPGAGGSPPGATPVAVESFPPSWLLRGTGDRGRLVVITQVRFEDADWGLLAVAGDRSLQSPVVQETFHQWAVLMSTSLTQEKSNADLARQAAELATAHQRQRALLEEVRISEERYALAAEAARGAVWDWTIGSGSVYYSSRWKALIGHRDNEVGVGPDEWLGRIHPDDAPQVREQLERARAGVADFFDFEHRLRTSTGEYRWIGCTGRSVQDPDGRVHRLVGSFTDVTARRLLQEQLEQEALFDGLTGLAKASLFKDRLEEAIVRSRQCTEYRFAVLYVDLNGFKAVNDTLGHGVGDELLAGVGQRLRESLRWNDTAARLGGDEFGVLINEVAQVADIAPIIKRMASRITAPYPVGAGMVTVGASIGVAISDARCPTADTILDEADAAMYRAKRRSREHPSDAGAFVATGDSYAPDLFPNQPVRPGH